MTFVSQSNVLMCVGGVLRDNTRLNKISYLANARSLSSSAFGIVHPANPDIKEAHGSTVSKGRKTKISYETFDFCSWYVHARRSSRRRFISVAVCRGAFSTVAVAC